MPTIGDCTEAAPYYFTYIDLVPPGDIRDLIDTQGRIVFRALPAIKTYELRMTGTLAGFFNGVVFAQGRASQRELIPGGIPFLRVFHS